MKMRSIARLEEKLLKHFLKHGYALVLREANRDKYLRFLHKLLRTIEVALLSDVLFTQAIISSHRYTPGSSPYSI